ncbi:MAG: LapA family protein [Gammaproteobacteria bacterium]
MKLLVTIVFFIIFTVALIFSLLNFQSVQINFFFTSFSLPLALALTIELFVGIIIGLLAAAMHILKLQSQYSKLVKQADRKS